MTDKDCIPASRSSNGTPLFNCVCPDCGKVRLADKRKLERPCQQCAMARRKTHGLSDAPIYRMWSGMVARCTYPSASSYRYYGSRGIDVCKAWRDSPSEFFSWAMANGYQEGLEIDRRDTDGDYTPENCRFIPHMINSQLRRNARCTLEQAKQVKQMLEQGTPCREVALTVGVPYMSAWHISKGNTWRNA